MITLIRFVAGVFLLCAGIGMLMVGGSASTMAYQGVVLLIGTVGVWLIYQSCARKDSKDDEKSTAYMSGDILSEEEEA